MRLGIGLITFNRRARALRAIDHIRRFTKEDFWLVVADDGSSDDTRGSIEDIGVEVISGENRGVCWNKNRALFYLSQLNGCDVSILIEDDSHPTSYQWECEWVTSSRRYGHMNLAGEWFEQHFISGKGTSVDPIISGSLSGQVSSFSREAVSYVGFLDSRFKDYGVGHVEHSRRMIRSGFGGSVLHSAGEVFYLLKSNIVVEDAPSFKNPNDLERNMQLMASTANEPLYRAPWQNDEEMHILKTEMASVMSKS